MKIVIIGAGNMGGWLARNLAAENELILTDQYPEKSKQISLQNSKIQSLSALEEIKKFKPGFLINAVSIRNTRAAFESVLPYLPPETILADMASVKGHLPEFYKKCGFRFVSVHPMFGPTFANVDRIEEENAVIIKESDPQGAAFFRKFFTNLGLNIHEYSFREHDDMMAYSLSLPFASSMVFAACMRSQTVPGTTFKKHRNIAEGLLAEDDFLLSEILFNPHSLSQLEKITNKLEFLKHVIRGRDTEEAVKFFNRLRSNMKRSGLPSNDSSQR